MSDYREEESQLTDNGDGNNSDNTNPIFISFASEDILLVKKVSAMLEGEGYKCWYANRNLTNENTFNIQLVERIKATEVMVVIVTEHTEKSLFVPRELSLANNKQKGTIPKIVPILFDMTLLPDSLELFINTDHYLSNIDYDNEVAFYKAIVNRIESAQDEYDKKLISDARRTQHKKFGGMLTPLNSDWVHGEVSKYVVKHEVNHVIQMLKRYHIIFIHSAQHSGKLSTALYAMSQLQTDKLYEYDSRLRLKDLFEAEIPESSGIVIEVTMDMASFLANMTEKQIETFLLKIREKNSYLAISSSSNEGHPFFNDYSVFWQHEYDTREILIRYINVYEQRDKTELSRILSEIESILPKKVKPRQADYYYLKLTEISDGDLTYEELKHTTKDKTKERIKSWFKHNRDFDDLSFYLTLTVFDHCSYSYIFSKSKILSHLLRAEHQGSEIEVKQLVPRDEYIEKFENIKIKQISHSKYINYSTTEDVLVFLHEEDKVEIWLYLWMQYIELRPIIQQWVSKIGSTHGKKIRIKLATFISHLIEEDFHAVTTQMINKLLRSDIKHNHLLVFDTLIMYSERDITNLQVVYSLVDKYSHDADSRLRKFAIMMLGAPKISMINLEKSLETLYFIYRFEEEGLKQECRTSLSRLTYGLTQQKSLHAIYYSFWIRQLSNNSEERIFAVDILLYMLSQNQSLIFYTSEQYIKQFWVPFSFIHLYYEHSIYYDAMYKKRNELLVSIKNRANANEERQALFDYFYKQGQIVNKNYLEAK